jgi:hypothetical protein
MEVRMRRRCALAWVALLLILLVVPCAREAEGRRGEPPPLCEGAEAMLDAQGFAVCPGGVGRIHAPYRWPTGPVFVTADAGLAGYLLCLRKLLQHETGGYDDASLPLLWRWDSALVKTAKPGAADPARKVVKLLLRLHRDTPGDDEDVEAEILRMRRWPADVPFLGLAATLDRRPVQHLWVGEWLPGPERFQVLLYVLTRASFAHDPVRERLQQTMPGELRALIAGYLERVGELRAVFPGAHGVFDVHRREGLRLPPGILATQPDLYALDYGARFGIPWAKVELEGRDGAELIQPVAASPPAESLRGTLDVVLREIPGKPGGVPPLFRSEAWQRLELQTLLGAEVLWRRAVGTATSAAGVLGAEDHPGFVHPDPAFWRALSRLAKQTAGDARERGIRWHVPPQRIVDDLEASAKRKLEKEEPFTARELLLFQRLGVGSWSLMWVEGWADRMYREDDAKGKAVVRRNVEHVLFGDEKRKGLFDAIREGRDDPGRAGGIGHLGKLAKVAVKLATLAEHQIAGEDAPDAKRVLMSFGFLMEDIEDAYRGPDDPIVTCARALIDGELGLFHGLGRADTLWVRYPWKDEVILCRGAVFSYREDVSRSFVGERRWKAWVRGANPPKRPAWTRAFVPSE